MPIVCFFGPDGSGKTTLARSIAKEFIARGFRVKISWMRGTHTLVSLLAKLMTKFETFKGLKNPYYGLSIPKNLRRLWQLLEFLSIMPILITKFILPSFFITVIAERYLLDFLVWISITTSDYNYINRFEAKFLTALANLPKVKVYISADLKELSKRSKEDANFLTKQLKLYDNLALAVHAYKLNTTDKSIEESLRKLSDIIFNYQLVI